MSLKTICLKLGKKINFNLLKINDFKKATLKKSLCLKNYYINVGIFKEFSKLYLFFLSEVIYLCFNQDSNQVLKKILCYTSTIIYFTFTAIKQL